jgi:hypothetical protein
LQQRELKRRVKELLPGVLNSVHNGADPNKLLGYLEEWRSLPRKAVLEVIEEEIVDAKSAIATFKSVAERYEQTITDLERLRPFAFRGPLRVVKPQ